jgi:hypothetical protein
MIFDAGVRVRTRAQTPNGHTRLPKYLAGREGRIVQNLGTFAFPDDVIRNIVRNVTLYTVEFADGDLVVRADLFEPYLEACE